MLLVVVALCTLPALSKAAWADDPRLEARSHYQAGLKFYSGGDYKSAITEFSTAQQLAAADLNNYNLALCYDKLGDAPTAIQYYREYINKVPNSDKRAEVDASISRLEAALKSAAAKQDEAKKADDAKKAADDAAAAKKAEDDKANAAASAGVAAGGAATAGAGPTVGGATGAGAAGAQIQVGVGSTGTPSTGQTVATGDAQLDRVASIDINSLRGNAVAMPATGGPQNGAAAAGGPAPNGQPALPNAPPPPTETPWYKKWWVWGIIVVGVVVVIEIATTNSSNGNQQVSGTARDYALPPDHGVRGLPNTSGLTVFHF